MMPRLTDVGCAGFVCLCRRLIRCIGLLKNGTAGKPTALGSYVQNTFRQLCADPADGGTAVPSAARYRRFLRYVGSSYFSLVWPLQLPLGEVRMSFWCRAMEIINDRPALAGSGRSPVFNFSASSQMASKALLIFSVLNIVNPPGFFLMAVMAAPRPPALTCYRNLIHARGLSKRRRPGWEKAATAFWPHDPATVEICFSRSYRTDVIFSAEKVTKTAWVHGPANDGVRPPDGGNLR